MTPRNKPTATGTVNTIPSVIGSSTGYNSGAGITGVAIGSGSGNYEPTQSKTADLATQAAVSKALAPYMNQLALFANEVNRTGGGPAPMIHGLQGKDIPASPTNQWINNQIAGISDPNLRKELTQSDAGIGQAIGNLVPALQQQNTNAGPSGIINALLSAIQSRIDYYGNANALPSVNQNPVANSLANLLAAITQGTTQVPQANIPVPGAPVSTPHATSALGQQAATPAPTTPAPVGGTVQPIHTLLGGQVQLPQSNPLSNFFSHL
jgi:hypothetical protein